MSAHTIDLFDLRMARNIAAKYGPRGDGDLESAAMKGLLEAARTFNGTGTWRGFAHMRIKSRVTNELRRAARATEVPTTADDMADLTVTIEVDTSAFRAALAGLADDVRLDFMAGHIDRRLTSHCEALETVKAALT